jgi:hypothetical protein
MHRCCSPRYEMIVENVAELPFGEIRGGVERCVQVLQTGREQRYVKHLGLCKPYVEAQVGYRQSIIGFDQLRPAGWTPLALGELDAEPRYGRVRVVGEQSYQQQRPLSGGGCVGQYRACFQCRTKACDRQRFFVIAVEAYPHTRIDERSVDFIFG